MNSTDLLNAFIETLKSDLNKEPSTMETVTNLFKNLDIITLPVFLILFIIIKIYNTVKENKHFNKSYEQKDESMKHKSFSNNINNELVKTIGETVRAENVKLGQKSNSYVINQTQKWEGAKEGVEA